MAKAKAYKVIAPLALVRTSSDLRYVYLNAPVPADVDPEHLERLINLGMVEEVKDTESKPEPSKQDAPPPDDLEALDYPALQEKAKEKDIAANQSRDDLLKALRA